MSNYGSSIYGLSKYGSTSRLAYSVAPMSLVVLDYYTTDVFWQVASGDFSRFRLVRNQNSYPEHSEDGVIVLDVISNTITTTYFRDGISTTAATTISPGKPIYYSMFLFTSANVWVNAGKIGGVIPSNHNSQQTMLDTLPRVFTSDEQSPLSEPSTTSDLYNFLSGLSFTVDEFLTYLDLLNPDHTLISTPEPLISLETAHRGLTQEPSIPLKNQKALVREAIFMYTRKGTASGLSTYVESLTGYAPDITVSSNLLLTPQDSTFYQSTGNWSATGATIATSTDTSATPVSTTTSIDNTYTCKVTATTSTCSMTLGTSAPITQGIPVTAGVTHTLSAQIKSPSSAGTITPKITFYDYTGTIIGSPISGTAVSANNTWQTVSLSARPTKSESQALSKAVGDGVHITYTTNTSHTYAVGATVIVSGFTTFAANTATSGTTITSTTTNTFTVASSFNGTTGSTETGTSKNTETTAVYAGITFSYNSSGVYYLDRVCLQQGSSTTFDEARAIDVYLHANKTNYIHNPSFETNTTDGWTASGITFSQSTSIPSLIYSGTHSATGTTTSTSGWTFTSSSMPVTAGLYYAASAYFKATTDMKCTFIGKDIDGNTVDLDTFDMGTAADWTRFSKSDLASLTDGIVSYQIQFSGHAGTFFLDSVQFEQSNGLTSSEYFDGSLPTAFGAVWTGTTNNSPTDLYYSKSIKVSRLQNTLVDWVPDNSFWRIRTSAGVEATNLTV